MRYVPSVKSAQHRRVKGTCLATPISIHHHERSLTDKLSRAWAYVGYGAHILPSLLLPIFPDRSATAQIAIHDRIVRLYRHWPNCPKLLEDWDALSLRVPGATPFQSPHWQCAVARFADSLGSLRLVTVHQQNRLLAVVPLERKANGHWHTPGTLTTDYLQPLVDPENAAGTWRAVLESIREFAGPSLKRVTFDLVSANATCREQLTDLPASTRFTASDEIVNETYRIPLAPTWQDYLARLEPHDRKELRRKIKKAEEKGGAQLVVNDGELSIRHALNDVFHHMITGGGGKGRKAKWLFKPHFRMAAPALAKSGRLIVYQLFLQHKLAASLIALPCKDHQILWCGAMDKDLGHWSPGIVLFGLVFKHAIERGELSIDLLRGQYPYKYALGAVDVPLHQITLTPR